MGLKEYLKSTFNWSPRKNGSEIVFEEIVVKDFPKLT